MSNIGNYISRLIRQFDLFSTVQYIRYKGEPRFKTATGGCASLAIIIILIAVSSGEAYRTLNKEMINSSTIYRNQVDPQNMTINFSQDGNFMVAVSLLNSTTSQPFLNLFSVVLYPKLNSLDLFANSSDRVYLVPCTPDHFSFTSDTTMMYDRMMLNNSLCPPLNFSVTFGGRQSSDGYSYFTMQVVQCNPEINQNCANQSEFQSIFNNKNQLIKLQISYVNTIINPGELSYRSLYIEDQNRFYFTIKNALYIQAQIQQYEINTDQTIMPYSDIIKEYAPAIPYIFSSSTIPVASNPNENVYAYIVFTKSEGATLFIRSFNKIDTYFSYIGGLIGTIVGCFFLMHFYSESAYLISIAEKVFNYDQQQNINSKGFNFLQFMKMGIKRVVQNFYSLDSWSKTDMYIRSASEMAEQLSIQLLLEKISLFEEALSTILTQHQLETLLLKEKRPILSAEFIRKKHVASKNIMTELLEKMKFGQDLEKRNTSNRLKVETPCETGHSNEMDFKNPIQIGVSINHIKSQRGVQQETRSEVKIDNEEQMRRQITDSIKSTLFKVLKQGNQGDQTSKRIIERTNKHIIENIGKKSPNSESMSSIAEQELAQSPHAPDTEEIEVIGSPNSSMNIESENN